MSNGIPEENLRTPPNSIELEQALLGSCILEGGQESIALCLQRQITPESFYYPAHRVLFQVLCDIYQSGQPINELIVAEVLNSQGKIGAIGGISYLTTICSRIDTPAHLAFYVDRIRSYELIRRVITVSESLIERAYRNVSDIGQFLGEAEESIFSVSKDVFQQSAVHVDVPMEQAAQNVQKLLQRKGDINGLRAGYADLDRMTGGFHGGEMIVLAARPSMGKTSLALNIAENVVLPAKGKGTPTLFFSLEMSAEQLAMRLLCGRAGVNMSKLREGYVSSAMLSEIAKASQEFKEAPLWIDESSNLTILEMRARARRIHSRHTLGLVIIDYLQLLSGTDPRMQREQQIAEISRGVKAMAKELKVPVIVLSQLNRESEKEGRQPRLSDLRESGAIEQDADVVLLLARAKEANEEVEREENLPVVRRDLLLAKQRNGPVGIVPLAFNRGLTKFISHTEQNYES